jgi:ring-1,2-phenylacetyl-CoA epoxidase subunit PaaC
MIPSAPHPHFEFVLRLADGSLVLSQRLSEWCGHGPVLEADIAFTNIALDLLGQARLLYAHAASLEGAGRDEDAFAYWRDDHEFRNPTLVEVPNGDFGQSVLRAWFYVLYQREIWRALAGSTDAALAAIAEKSARETAYHCTHLGGWVIRLGDGTEESHRRMQAALDYVWPYTRELVSEDTVDKAALDSGLAPGLTTVAEAWTRECNDGLASATLTPPATTRFLSTGRQGRHSEHLGYLLAEMQSLARAHPGARW